MPLPVSLQRPVAALALGGAILAASTGVAAAQASPKRALFATMSGANVIAQDGVKGARIFAKPGDYYVNVQTDDFRDSAIRGQLRLSR